MSSNTTDNRACLAYTRQSAFGRRRSLPRVSYTSTMKQIMGCYHLHIERTQTVRKNSSVGNDRPLSPICLLQRGRPPGAPIRPHQRPWPRLCSSCRCSYIYIYFTIVSYMYTYLHNISSVTPEHCYTTGGCVRVESELVNV